MTELEPRYACRAWGCRERFYSRFDLDEHCDVHRHHECEQCCERFTLAYYRDVHPCARRVRSPIGATPTSGASAESPARRSAAGATAAAAAATVGPPPPITNHTSSGVASHSGMPATSSRPPSSLLPPPPPASPRGSGRSDLAIDLTEDDDADFFNSPVASLKPLSLRDWASCSR